jgi:hypothetical protein
VSVRGERVEREKEGGYGDDEDRTVKPVEIIVSRG